MPPEKHAPETKDAPPTKDAREWLTDRAEGSECRDVWHTLGKELAVELDAAPVVAQPDTAHFPHLQAVVGRCQETSHRVCLEGKPDTNAAGKRTTSVFPCDSWSGCDYCHTKKANAWGTWLYRCVCEWCDHERLHASAPPLTHIEEVRESVRNEGPFTLWSFEGDDSQWERIRECLKKKKEFGIDYVRVEQVKNKQTGVTEPTFVTKTFGVEYVRIETDNSPAIKAVVALPPLCAPVKGLCRISSDRALEMIESALGSIPRREVVDEAKFKPVTSSRNWALKWDKDEQIPGNWIARGTTHLTKSEVQRLHAELGIGLLPKEQGPKPALHSSVYEKASAGGELCSWLLECLKSKFYTGVQLSVSGIKERFLPWRAFITKHRITDSQLARVELTAAFQRLPEPEDVSRFIPAVGTEADSSCV